MATNQIEQFKKIRNEITRFMMMYKFALQEMETRIDILQEEFHLLHEYNPIEHMKSRLKTPESIMNKMVRKGCSISFAEMKERIKDIAGLRITCSFISDIYRISEMLRSQSDLNIMEVRDYIQQPKPNGYQSLHLLVEVPVHMSDRHEKVCVEIQIRTIAMDFWASLEHKIYYKYNQAVPTSLLEELKKAADSATALDRKMERLHKEIEVIKEERADSERSELPEIMISNQHFKLPAALLELIDESNGMNTNK